MSESLGHTLLKCGCVTTDGQDHLPVPGRACAVTYGQDNPPPLDGLEDHQLWVWLAPPNVMPRWEVMGTGAIAEGGRPEALHGHRMPPPPPRKKP